MINFLISFLCFFLLIFSSYADVKAPNIYGKITKEFRYMSQKKEFSKAAQTSGIKDVANSETRIGLNGLLDQNLFQADYKIEIGINSNYDHGDATEDDGAIRVRVARVNAITKYGTLILGQTYTATALPYLKLDPFWDTGASILGFDQKEIMENMEGYLGHYYRSRKDLVGYESPVIDGFKLTCTVDKDSSVFNPIANNTHDHYEVNTSYDWGDKMMNGQVQLGYVGGKPTTANFDNESNLLFSVKFTYDIFNVGAGFQSYTKSSSVGGIEDEKITRLLATFKFNLKENSFLAMSYSNRHDKPVPGQEKEYSQFAVGFNYLFSKNLSVRMIASFLSANFTGFLTKDNTGNLVLVGTTLSF